MDRIGTTEIEILFAQNFNNILVVYKYVIYLSHPFVLAEYRKINSNVKYGQIIFDVSCYKNMSRSSAFLYR